MGVWMCEECECVSVCMGVFKLADFNCLPAAVISQYHLATQVSVLCGLGYQCKLFRKASFEFRRHS